MRPSSPTAFSDENDPFGDKRHAFNHQISERVKLLSQLPDKEFKLFHHLWGNCSRESQQQIAILRQQSMDEDNNLIFINNLDQITDVLDPAARPKYEDWEQILILGDILSLVRRINTSHLSPDDGSDAEKRYNTIKRHEALKMTSSENLLEFKRRFDHSLEAFTSVALPRPSDELLVLRFMDALDDSRFNGFKIERSNWSRTVPPIAPKTALL